MAKQKSDSLRTKISFGRRRKGKSKKSRRPKDKKVSEYRGQGR